MQNSTYIPQVEKVWPEHWLKKSWTLALHGKFRILYQQKFSSCFPDQQTIDEWAEVWGEDLAGISADQIKYALSYVNQRHPWPPTTGEFLACCRARPMPTKLLPYIQPASKSTAQERMTEILAILKTPKKSAVNHWKLVLDTPDLPVKSYEFAKEALEKLNYTVVEEFT